MCGRTIELGRDDNELANTEILDVVYDFDEDSQKVCRENRLQVKRVRRGGGRRQVTRILSGGTSVSPAVVPNIVLNGAERYVHVVCCSLLIKRQFLSNHAHISFSAVVAWPLRAGSYSPSRC